MEQESSVIQWLSREPTPFWHGDDEDSLSSPCHNGVEDEGIVSLAMTPKKK